MPDSECNKSAGRFSMTKTIKRLRSLTRAIKLHKHFYPSQTVFLIESGLDANAFALKIY